MFTIESLRAARLVAAHIGGQISGSFIVDPDTAKDIDIFCSVSQFNCAAARRKWPRTDKITVAGTTLLDSWATGREYYESNNTDDALYTTYRSEDGEINLIVVHDAYMLAFQISANRMRACPHKYKTKEARVALHHRWRERIRKYLSDAAAKDDSLHPDTDPMPDGWPYNISL